MKKKIKLLESKKATSYIQKIANHLRTEALFWIWKDVGSDAEKARSRRSRVLVDFLWMKNERSKIERGFVLNVWLQCEGEFEVSWERTLKSKSKLPWILNVGVSVTPVSFGVHGVLTASRVLSDVATAVSMGPTERYASPWMTSYQHCFCL